MRKPVLIIFFYLCVVASVVVLTEISSSNINNNQYDEKLTNLDDSEDNEDDNGGEDEALLNNVDEDWNLWDNETLTTTAKTLPDENVTIPVTITTSSFTETTSISIDISTTTTQDAENVTFSSTESPNESTTTENLNPDSTVILFVKTSKEDFEEQTFIDNLNEFWRSYCKKNPKECGLVVSQQQLQQEEIANYQLENDIRVIISKIEWVNRGCDVFFGIALPNQKFVNKMDLVILVNKNLDAMRKDLGYEMDLITELLPTEPSPTEKANKNLTNTIIYIVVGCVVGAFLISLLIFVFWRCKKNSRTNYHNFSSNARLEDNADFTASEVEDNRFLSQKFDNPTFASTSEEQVHKMETFSK